MSTTYKRAVHNNTNPYQKISQKLLKDTRLSATSIGLMVIILSNADTFELRAGYLKERSKLTRTQFYKAWDELLEHQYIMREYVGNHKWKYTINETVN